MGWADLDDGALLNAITGQFDVLLTVDASLAFQQSIAGRQLSLIVLRARSNRVGELARFIPELQKVLKVIASGDVRHIPAS